MKKLVLVGLLGLGLLVGCGSNKNDVITAVVRVEDTDVEDVSVPQNVETEEAYITIDWSYYEDFKKLLFVTSSAYDMDDEEFLENSYVLWYTNQAFADIIVNEYGNLEYIGDDYDYAWDGNCSDVYENLEEGFYYWGGDGFQMSAEIVRDENIDGYYAVFDGYTDYGSRTNHIESYITESEDGSYYMDLYDVYFSFDGECLYVDDCILVNDYDYLVNFTGEYEYCGTLDLNQ